MKNRFLMGLAAAALIAGATVASSQGALAADYRITITNATPGQPFAPGLLVLHNNDFSLFAAGEAPTDELAELAETGNPAPLEGSLDPLVVDTQVVAPVGDILQPFESIDVEITTVRRYLTAVGMLIATNDGFYGFRGVKLPTSGSVTYYAPAYDAGSETNNEASGDVPAIGNGSDPGINYGTVGVDREGYIHIHSGIFGVGDLVPADTDWNNPVASITIEKIPSNGDEE